MASLWHKLIITYLLLPPPPQTASIASSDISLLLFLCHLHFLICLPFSPALPIEIALCKATISDWDAFGQVC